MPHFFHKSAIALAFAVFPVSAHAQQPVGVVEATGVDTDQNVFIFAGRYDEDHAIDSVVPFHVDYENNYVLGGGYQKFFFEPLKDMKVGLEAGVAARIADPFSGEIWGGGVIRYDGFVLGNDWRVSPALTFGLSAVTSSFGTEEARRALTDGNASLLYYLGPEISIGKVGGDNEFFYRIQHRSGAWETLNHMGDGANAQVIGFRHKF